MRFCPECGDPMYPKKEGDGVFFVCPSCGYREVGKPDSDSYRLVHEGEEKEETPVIEKDQESLPKTTKKCPECGHDKAHWWMQQTRSADEPSAQFYRCVKCGYTWREC